MSEEPTHQLLRRVLTLEERLAALVLPEVFWFDELQIDMDFTGTDWDTKVECQTRGLRFSDSDTPFPTALRVTTSGTWTHSAGNGWQPACAVDFQGPALILPLFRPANWTLEIKWKYNPVGLTDVGLVVLGYIANSNQPGSYAYISDTGAGTSTLTDHLDTNDGDDTYTTQWTGAALAGAATRTYRFRCFNGCVSTWDDQDDAWHSYAGRYGAAPTNDIIPYTAAYAFLQTYPPPGSLATFWRVYLSALKLSYFV